MNNKLLVPIVLLVVIIVGSLFVLKFSPRSLEIGKKSNVIRVLVWGGYREKVLYDETVALFNRKFPDVKVLIEMASKDYEMILNSRLAGGGKNVPDIFALGYGAIPLYHSKDVLASLNDAVGDKSYQWMDFAKGVREMVTIETNVYMIPFQAHTFVVYYNKDVFDREGVPYPKADWTWDQLYDAAVKMTKRSYDIKNRWGFLFGAGDLVSVMLTQKYYDYLQRFGKPLTYRTQDVLDVISFISNCYQKTSPLPTGEWDAVYNCMEAFISGRVAMFMWIRPAVGDLIHAKGLRWDIVPAPQLKNSSRKSMIVNGDGFVVYKNSQNLRYAKEFAKFLGSPEIEKKWMISGVCVPPRQSVIHSREFADLQPQHNYYFAEQLEYSERSYTNAFLHAIGGEVFSRIERFVNEEKMGKIDGRGK